MSTRLTKKGIPMADSQSLQLVMSGRNANDITTQYLSNALKNKGYGSITPSILQFLSTLECGVNYGSEIARNIGVSRQMVAKTVKELCSIGYLEQQAGTGKQKQIVFTEIGERLMSDARQLLAELDKKLHKTIGKKKVNDAIECLELIKQLLE